MMDHTNPSIKRCLTPDERDEIQASWRGLQAKLQPVGALVEQADLVDCDELHTAFGQLAGVFDDFERAVMRAQQVRLLHAGHNRPTPE